MRRLLRIFLLATICGCGHAGKDAATSEEARRTSAAVASIDDLCDHLAAIAKDANRRRLFASLSANGQATPWHEYDSDEALQAYTEAPGYVIAELWRRDDGAVLVHTTATSDTGDWNHSTHYCYGPDGGLARTEFTMNSFVEDEGVRGIRVRHFSAGREILVTSETRDLNTNEKRDESEFQEQEPIYKTVSALPFAALLSLQPGR